MRSLNFGIRSRESEVRPSQFVVESMSWSGMEQRVPSSCLAKHAHKTSSQEPSLATSTLRTRYHSTDILSTTKVPGTSTAGCSPMVSFHLIEQISRSQDRPPKLARLTLAQSRKNPLAPRGFAQRLARMLSGFPTVDTLIVGLWDVFSLDLHTSIMVTFLACQKYSKVSDPNRGDKPDSTDDPTGTSA